MSKESLLKVVTGHSPLSSLSEFGIEIAKTEGGLQLTGSTEVPRVTPSEDEIIKGFRAYRNDPDNLRSWAFFLLAEGEIDLSSLEAEPSGNAILEALWEASETGTLSPRLLED